MPLVSKLTNVADAIREKTGSTGSLTLDGMVTAIKGIDGGGSGVDYLAQRCMGTLTEYSSDEVTKIGNYAFGDCSSLTSINFPACKSIGGYAFYSCSSLASVSFPACTEISNRAFCYCDSLASVSFPACATIGSHAFHGCSVLTSVNFPACTTIGYNTFTTCSALTSISFPVCTTISNEAFDYCTSLVSVNFPACTSIGSSAFDGCSSVESVNFPACISIGNNAFRNCQKLNNLTLESSTVCILANSNAFTNTSIMGGTGYIYVPSSLVASYKVATNWTYFSNQILAIGETPSSESTFTINGTIYKMDEGMTWAEWCASDYNINYVTVSTLPSPTFNGYVMIDSSFVYDADGNKVSGTAAINEGMAYTC